MEFENKIGLLEDSIDTLDDLFYVFDKNGNFLDWNKTVQEVTGYTEKEIRSMSPSDFFEGKDREKIRNAVEKTIETGKSRTEAKLKTKNGRKIPYEFKTSQLKTENINGICGIGRNLTERKKREQELKEKTEKYSTLVDQSYDGIIVIQNKKFVFVNSKFREITGYSKEELLGTKFNKLIHPDDREKVKKRYRDRIEGKNPPKRYEVKMINKEGQEKIIDFSVSRIEFKGQPAIMANLRDITKRKKYEQDLKNKNNLLRSILETSIDGILVVDKDREIITHNSCFVEMFDIPDKIINKKEDEKALDWVLENKLENPDQFIDLVEYLYRNPKEDSRDKIYLNDGRVFDRYSSPIQTDEGKYLGRTWFFRDITEQEEYEQDLQEKTDQLDILNRIIRHDIRNDMNVIDLYLENLLEECKDKKDQKVISDLEKIQDRSQHVTELTKTSRDIAETIATDKQKTISVDLKEALKEQIEDTKQIYPDAEIEAKTDIPDIKIKADEMLASVFRNILFNAIQHNDKQTPKIEISTKQDKNTVTISISDNGPGIPDDLKQKVFGKEEKSMDSTGTGIGLYLVEKIVDSYNGDVWIEGNKPEGCIFKVELQKV